MKRTFKSIISLVLALTTVLSCGVFVLAEGETALVIKCVLNDEETDVTNKSFDVVFVGSNTSIQLTASGGSNTYEWSSDGYILSNNAKCTATFSSEGTKTITCTSGNQTATVTVRINKTVNSIAVTTQPKTEYSSMEKLDLSGMVVTATYSDNSTAPITNYTTEPANGTTLYVSDHNGKTVKVIYSDTINTNTNALTVKDRKVTKIEATNLSSTSTFKEDDDIPQINLKVYYDNDTTEVITSGYTVTIGGSPAGSKFKASDDGKIMAVSYAGKTVEITLKITPKETETEKPATNEYTYTLVSNPTKLTYKVGESFDATGMVVDIYKNGSYLRTLTSEHLQTILNHTFTASEIGTGKSLYNTFSFQDEGKSNSIRITVSGIKVEAAAETLTVYSIDSITMEENDNTYPLGYKFTLSDVYSITYRTGYSSSTRQTIKVADIILGNYSNTFDIEVLTLDKNNDRERKTGTEAYYYSKTLREDDVYKDDKTDTSYAWIRLYIDDKYIDKQIKVGDSGVGYYYRDNLVTIYDDIDEALEFTEDQDPNITGFYLSSVGTRPITLKLGENQEASAYTDVDICHNVEIDLNGHSLKFYWGETASISKDNREYTLTVTNTSSTPSEFLLYYKTGTSSSSRTSVKMKISKDEKLVFEYDEDIPGIYTITVSAGNGGTIKADYTIDNGEITVGHGNDVKFTVTPNSGYTLDTIKADSKTVSSSDYTVSSTGVVTYTLKAVTKSQKIEATFKETVTEWKNPFKDVSSTASYYSAIQFVYEHELFQGTSTTEFSPSNTMTRAMFVTVLGRLANVDVSRFKTTSYSDVPINSTTSWYAPYVEWATQMGIVEGYGDGTFGPNNKITRQQMYVMMYRYTIYVENLRVTLSNSSINASDAEDVADWAYDAVRFASQNNFLVKIGTSSRIEPTGEAKRYELAQLLEKYCFTVLGWEK